jgi:alkanesulfonate monooxygenase SsuD/methylene tetrahydromethanopterin reductase-like flavin-dependent oxidoreductase (luciferase family)
MKFGVDIECDQDEFEKSVQQAELAERLGYNSISIAEHHNAIGYVPLPLTALAAIATRTSRLLLASNIVILPLYHPVQVAEQAAMVQFISRGRLLFGVGLGYLPDEFASMSVPFEERAGRMAESLALLNRLWTEEDVSFDGKYYHFKHATVRPRLDQIGLPPVLVGGWVEAAIRRAARLADGWIPGPTVDFEVLRKCYGIFRDELRKQSKPLDVEYLATRELFCAPTREKAIEVGGRPMYQFYRDTYLQWPHPYLREAERQMSYEELSRDRFIIGDPDDCAQAVAKLREMGITHLNFRMQPPGVDWDDAVASMKLFMEQVVPQFR